MLKYFISQSNFLYLFHKKIFLYTTIQDIMGRAKRNNTSLTQCKTCGKHVKNIKRHLGQTQCSSFTIIKTIKNNCNEATVRNNTYLSRNNDNQIIGMNIGVDFYNSSYRAQKHNLVPTVTKGSKRLKRQCLNLQQSLQGSYSNSSFDNDNQSVSILTIQTCVPDNHGIDETNHSNSCNVASIPTNNYEDPDDYDSYLAESESVQFKTTRSESSSIIINACSQDNPDDSSTVSGTITPGNLYIPNENVLYNRINSKGFKAYARIYDIFGIICTICRYSTGVCTLCRLLYQSTRVRCTDINSRAWKHSK
jgi:hypothetical protein